MDREQLAARWHPRTAALSGEDAHSSPHAHNMYPPEHCSIRHLLIDVGYSPEAIAICICRLGSCSTQETIAFQGGALMHANVQREDSAAEGRMLIGGLATAAASFAATYWAKGFWSKHECSS